MKVDNTDPSLPPSWPKISQKCVAAGAPLWTTLEGAYMYNIPRQDTLAGFGADSRRQSSGRQERGEEKDRREKEGTGKDK